MALYDKYPVAIFNSLGKKKEKFEPINAPRVGLYVCGPTVYNEAHLGNVRSFLTFDVVWRYLEHLGYKVRYVRNITDVGHLVSDADEGEDKIEKRARLEELEPMEIVQKYTNGFHYVTHLFNLKDPSIEPTATGHIQEQIEMVKRIIDNGYGYEVNGSVYFDVKKFSEKYDYGKLSGRKVDELLEQTRDNLEGGNEKQFFADFAIWKGASENTLMKWNSPWGQGVPGWHLECSVMSTKYLGEQFDIHGGGMDLKFPHHECEIAQSVGADGTEPVRYWMHGNMLTVNGTKMSKSLGNSFLPLELVAGDHPLLDQGYSPMTARFFMLQANYRSTLDFSNEALKAAEKGYKRLMNALKSLNGLSFENQGKTDYGLDDEINKQCEQVYVEMSDDFNTPKAIAVLFELVNKINAFENNQLNLSSIKESTFDTLKKVFNSMVTDVLGLMDESDGESNKLQEVMNFLINMRDEARANKNWELSDKIRDDLSELGITLNDGKDGSSFSIN
ncbi:MAG: cysteine--tRNA ligase [Crocinitomicaceae bacterium]|nr:cysteine--tRNA ligase [Crocinitomicaceae bacterium]|tara:strand:+ start:13751 stop:15256 length:1506 start_codon:yes stop_codon:yes gene_type:complete